MNTQVARMTLGLIVITTLVMSIGTSAQNSSDSSVDNESGASSTSFPVLNVGPVSFSGNNDSQIVQVTQNGSGAGLTATTAKGTAIVGVSNAITAYPNGVYGQTASPTGSGLNGNAVATSGSANGVSGATKSPNGSGIFGINNASAGGTGTGVTGIYSAGTGQGVAIYGQTASNAGFGVDGTAVATSGNTSGVYGTSLSTSGTGVTGVAGAASGLNFGILGIANSSGGVGIQASNVATNGFVALATNPYLINAFVGQSGKFNVDNSGNGYFSGNLNVTGTLTKGSGSFKIDHPLDPANRYLSHSFVESPDMMNVYNGNITTNHHGLATVVLPDYFEALNRDFRYQLTVIGEFAQAIVAKKIARNCFVIRTSKPGVEVSWQVTGIRQDAYANANRIPVEEVKPVSEQGYYLHPEVFGQPDSKSIARADKAIPTQDVLARAPHR